MCPVTAAADPANEIVTIRRCERQNLHKLHAGLVGQLHQHIVWLHRLRDLSATLTHANLAGDGPQILAIVEHLRVGHVIQAVNLPLQFEQ